MGSPGRKRYRRTSDPVVGPEEIRDREYDIGSSSGYGMTPIQYATFYYSDRSLLELDDDGFRRVRLLETVMVLSVDDDFRTRLTRWGEGIVDGSIGTYGSAPEQLYRVDPIGDFDDGSRLIPTRGFTSVVFRKTLLGSKNYMRIRSSILGADCFLQMGA